MHYEINIALNGGHVCAIDPRSTKVWAEVLALLPFLRHGFPAGDGFEITVTKWETTGEPVDITKVKTLTPAPFA